MTCVVGITDGSNVWIGGDSAAADGWKVRECLSPKVFAVDEVLIGYTVSYRMGQILEAHLELPEPPKRQSDVRETGQRLYVTEKLVERIRGDLHRYRWATEEKNKQEGCGLLIGYRSHLFCLGDDYGVTEMADGYDAIGCGAKFALGALYAQSDMPPADRVKLALEAAAHMSGGVMPPFYIMCLRPDGTVGLLL